VSEEDVPRKQGDEEENGKFNVEEAFNHKTLLTSMALKRMMPSMK
jgi:hypothetical protein